MHPPRPLRAFGLLLAAVTATVAVWFAASPPPTQTVAPAAVGVR